MNGTPADLAGLQPGMIITAIGNQSIMNSQNLSNVLSRQQRDVPISITANNTVYQLEYRENPNIPNAAYLGVTGDTKSKLKSRDAFSMTAYYAYSYLTEFLFWFQFLSLNVGLINLYPIFMTDGAQMFRVFMCRLIKDKKRALKVWSKMNSVFLIILVFIALVGLVRWLIG